MNLSSVFIFLFVGCLHVHAYDVSIFYCGFGGDYCGQSVDDDVHVKAKFVILAFANTQQDGSIIVDDVNFPVNLTRSWQSNGKKVFISVGGQNGNWANVFTSNSSINNFISTVTAVVSKYGLDGVDLDIQSYIATPRTVANAIILLKNALGSKLIIVSPEDVAVYQGSTVPDPDKGGNAFNYFVPIINLADSSIDYYQPQAYNNWYDGELGGSLIYLQDVYLNWRNLNGTGQWDAPLANFTGVNGDKLLIGLTASTSAGGAGYYAQSATISKFKDWLASFNYPLKGFMIWDSHWDKINSYAVSTICSA